MPRELTNDQTAKRRRASEKLLQQSKNDDVISRIFTVEVDLFNNNRRRSSWFKRGAAPKHVTTLRIAQKEADCNCLVV
ncbi:unnamed protein product [Bursaphelenchus okinawaensis]|uniref:Uncharacterized protein n=1 Tax=Bursaphelenchus okinawaensis TaxID=465554 RepID=A0A811L7K9_9BILA|nr:unnamed protein product [Bursaphelenchus okinawaensis]CAG9118368.1 unnamed protein product [Bursaphelenchus okinawaensis]